MSSPLIYLLALGACLATVLAACTTQTQPNPIAARYPASVTGVLNATLAVLPISLAEAQQLVGKYKILTKAIQAELPGWPAGQYPVVLQAAYDHDIRTFGVNALPDFSRIGIEFPFLDLLGDGYSSFRYGPNLAVSATNPGAQAGTALYGIRVLPSTFDPPCDGYARTSSSSASAYFNAKYDLTLGGPSTNFTTLFSPASTTIPLSFFQNTTNQPLFADPTRGCNNQIRFFNTSLTSAPYTPTMVKGTVRVPEPFWKGGRTWKNVQGTRFASAFIENNYIPCSTYKGYSGTGPGD